MRRESAVWISKIVHASLIAKRSVSNKMMLCSDDIPFPSKNFYPLRISILLEYSLPNMMLCVLPNMVSCYLPKNIPYCTRRASKGGRRWPWSKRFLIWVLSLCSLKGKQKPPKVGLKGVFLNFSEILGEMLAHSLFNRKIFHVGA